MSNEETLLGAVVARTWTAAYLYGLQVGADTPDPDVMRAKLRLAVAEHDRCQARVERLLNESKVPA